MKPCAEQLTGAKSISIRKVEKYIGPGTVLEDHTILCPEKKVLADSLMYDIR